MLSAAVYSGIQSLIITDCVPSLSAPPLLGMQSFTEEIPRADVVYICSSRIFNLVMLTISGSKQISASNIAHSASLAFHPLGILLNSDFHCIAECFRSVLPQAGFQNIAL